jgi:two-component system cell cycle sensor histidine kinase/response regulator CckA
MILGALNAFKGEDQMRLVNLAVEAADDGIAIADTNNKLLFMNKSYLSLHGYDPEHRDKYLATDWRHLYNEAGQKQINEIVLPTTKLKGRWSGFIPIMRKDGKVFDADASLTLLGDGSVLGVIRDASERTRLQKESDAMREQLFHSARMDAMIRLTGKIAADFHDKLTLIYGNADLIALYLDKSDDDVKEYLKELLNTCRESTDLLEQLMAFSFGRPEAANKSDAAEILTSLIKEMRQDGIEIHTDAELLHRHVILDATRLRDVLKKICDNAAEAGKNLSQNIHVEIKPLQEEGIPFSRDIFCDDLPDKTKSSIIRLRSRENRHYLLSGYIARKQRYVEVKISDGGSGIDPEILPMIFDPYFTTKDIHSHTGLGLAFVHGTMASAKAAIIIETELGRGTDVRLFFPEADME